MRSSVVATATLLVALACGGPTPAPIADERAGDPVGVGAITGPPADQPALIVVRRADGSCTLAVIAGAERSLGPTSCWLPALFVEKGGERIVTEDAVFDVRAGTSTPLPRLTAAD